MKKIIQGVRTYQQDVFGDQEGLFSRLATGQHPEAMFITCSDSRIDPCLITQTDPGDLFVLRNAGNIVPPYGASNGGEMAAVEFAVAALGVKDIIVCGHSHCGAISGLLNPSYVEPVPTVAEWLKHAQTTKTIVDEKHADKSGDELMIAAIQENVLVQLENLRTHPAVAAKVSQGELGLHAWVYTFEYGQIFAYDAESQKFSQLSA